MAFERKYKILPGVPTPDYEEILKASSDYTDPGALEFTERQITLDSEKKAKPTLLTSDTDVEELKKLGIEVSEEEERSKEISQERMDAIKQKRVMAPASIEALREVASKRETDDKKREEIEQGLKERDERAAKEEELERIRAERREQQKKAVEEIKARTASNEAAAEAAEAARAKENEDENLILSDEETADSFSEFL